MPWKVVADHDGCAFAVVKITDGTTVACHETKDGAQNQVEALYANTEGEYAAARQEFRGGQGGGGSWGPKDKAADGTPRLPKQRPRIQVENAPIPGAKVVVPAIKKIANHAAPRNHNPGSTASRGGGGRGGSFALEAEDRMEAAEQALCALADILFEQS